MIFSGTQEKLLKSTGLILRNCHGIIVIRLVKYIRCTTICGLSHNLLLSSGQDRHNGNKNK